MSTRPPLHAHHHPNPAPPASLTNHRYTLKPRPHSYDFRDYTETRPDGAPTVRSVALKYTHLLSF